MAGWIKMPLDMKVGLGPGDFVLDGDLAPLPKKGAAQKGSRAPQFPAHVYCGQTAGWIKMPLGTKVGLGPYHIVLDGDPAPPERGTAAAAMPLFSALVYCQTVAHLSILLSSC